MNTPKMKIEIWSDIACPFCYIGKAHLENALNDFEFKDQIELLYYSYQLDPQMRYQEGQTAVSYLVQRKGMPEAQVRQMMAQIETMAKDAGVVINFSTNLPANTMKAHKLIHLAKESHKDQAVMNELFKAHFVEGQNIEDSDALTQIGTKQGLKAEAVQEAISTDQYRSAITSEIAEAAKIGVQGVPFFVLNRKYGISGAQPVATLKKALTQSFEEWQKDTPLIVDLGPEGANDASCGPEGCKI